LLQESSARAEVNAQALDRVSEQYHRSRHEFPPLLQLGPDPDDQLVGSLRLPAHDLPVRV
jgi:hypothetical protein